MTPRRTFAIIIVLIFLLGTVVCLTGCSRTKEFKPTKNEIGGLVVIAKQDAFIPGYIFDQYILYDPDTLVMYIMIDSNSGTTISMLYNADGTPKLYNPDK